MADRKWEDGPDPQWVIPGTLWKIADINKLFTVKAIVRDGALGYCPDTMETFGVVQFSLLRLPDPQAGDAIVFQDINYEIFAEFMDENLPWHSGQNMHQYGYRAVVRENIGTIKIPDMKDKYYPINRVPTVEAMFSHLEREEQKDELL
jgi:hypothetical protein